MNWPLVTRRRYDATVDLYVNLLNEAEEELRELHIKLDMTAQRELTAAVSHQQADAERRRAKKLKRQAEQVLAEARRHE